VSQAVLTLLAAFVGAAAAIAAQSLNPILTARRGHFAWLRDKRAALCEEFMASLDETHRELENYIGGYRDSSLIGAGSAGQTRSLEQFKAAHNGRINRLFEINSKLRIYGSDRLVDDLEGAMSALRKFEGQAGLPGEFNEVSVKMNVDSLVAIEKAYQAVRRELEVKRRP